MRQDEQIRVLKDLMAHIGAATNVDAGGIMRAPVETYTCENRAADEWREFFRNYPQVVGMSADLPDPGTFITRDDFGTPVLGVRRADGEFAAYLNVCRHRGAIVEGRANGKGSRFSCPFHAWTYDNKGSLIGVPKAGQFGEIDRSCHGLVRLPAVERHGLLWVHPNPDGEIGTDDLLDELAQELESWDFSRLVRTGEDRYDHPINWKLAIDTFGETYHFSRLHKNTLYPLFHGNVQAYDTYGRNHRMTLCTRAIDELVERPESEWKITDGAFPVYYLFPNIQINVGASGVVLVQVYPSADDPRKSHSRISFYAWPEAQSDAAQQLQRAFADIIRDEDYVAAAACQRGIDAGAIREILFGRNEPALHHYHNTYRSTLGLDQLEIEAR